MAGNTVRQGVVVPRPIGRRRRLPRLLTVEQLAAEMSCSRSKAYEVVMSGELPSVTIGRMRRVPLVAFEQWISEKLEERQ